MTTEMLLQVTGLEKTFAAGHRSQQVLRGVNLNLESGEVLVLLGTSGSGKSTLLNLIAGLEYPDAGDIYILGTRLTAQDEQQRTLFRRRHLGIVFQFFNLIPTLTVSENLLLPLRFNNLQETPGQLSTLLARLGLTGRGELYPEQLSGGEQQRVAIGRALIHRPALLLADEPTGSLDNDTADVVMELLFEQVRALNQSLILVTHNEALAEKADRVLKLHQGVLGSNPNTSASCLNRA
ncbi:ABC transporter ATP-binding protein [Motiliproteus sp. MSK22-1]|uniref:ABC transporter ATP-binding protein n=1 Tax=Motiliproteus sp. MSK22-1 TaxID=1897630 RepID=UPI000977334F|nr:ABC transporter ATP-binding protein [Motiliproteus sp. MSK22-1]OMH38021.1 hypothetical protein BGP75_06975 [Motiliproteus sp. MSK22-1]